MKWLKRIFSANDLAGDPTKKESKRPLPSSSPPVTGEIPPSSSPYTERVFEACRTVALAEVVRWLSLGADVNVKDRSGNTLLHNAAACGRTDIVELLIANGADVNASGTYWTTAMTAALKYHHKEVVRLLLERGADVNVKDSDGWTPLIRAAEMGDMELVQLLVDRGADVDAKSHENYGGTTACAKATEKGHADIVKLLLDKGADVDARDRGGRTALLHASQNGNISSVTLLLERGANVNAQDSDGNTALGNASEKGFVEIVKLLLYRDADVSAKTKYGITPLITASSHDHVDVIRLLLDKGADVNAKDDSGGSPLARADKLEVIRLLLDKGADIEAKDKYGRTPLFNCVSNRRSTEVAKLLLDRGADVNAEDHEGRTALIQASLLGYTEFAQLLEEAGAKKKALGQNAELSNAAQQFVEMAACGAARLRVSITQIPQIAVALRQRLLLEAGVDSRSVYDLFNDSLLSVCPVCNKYCAGKAFLMMDVMMGANTMFTGNSGGFERLLEGRCINYACNSAEHELFWCPDLSPEDFAYLQSKGIRIDPGIQRTRDLVWKPRR